MENKLLEALKEISEGKGAYDMDKLKHCSNTVDNMKAIADKAILEYEQSLIRITEATK